MKKIFLVISVFMLGLVLFGCTSSVHDGYLGKGKIMKFDFETNPTTGFDWQYEFLNGDENATIELIDEERVVPEAEGRVGMPSRVIYTFKATKPGKQILTFTYKRPWEGGDSAYDVVYELNVDKNLKITCLSKMKGAIESNIELSKFPNPTFE